MPRPRALVVDDNTSSRELAAIVLTQMGFEVDQAGDGQEALEWVAASRYDCVLMDCRMPVMDGLEATREIRRRWPDDPQVPIIALTAQAMEIDRLTCLDAGMNDHLAKPYRIHQLSEVVGRWVTMPRHGESDAADEPHDTTPPPERSAPPEAER